MTGQGKDAAAVGAGPLADPVTEAKRLIATATDKGLTMRVLGSVAVCMQSPVEGPLLPRLCGDIDIATLRGNRRATTDLLQDAGYRTDEMFNALHGARRLLFYDNVNGRKLDVFIGEFKMCHAIPIADRLDRETLTVPLAELMLTKLQVVELTERDQRDIYILCNHHPLSNGDRSGIEADYIAELCAKDWGLWRTSKATIEKCLANLANYSLPEDAARLIAERLQALWKRIDAEPKSARWRLRSRVGDRVRWYDEPEENAAAN